VSVLDVADVVVEYRRPGRDPVRAVAGVSLSLDAARILGLVGETGCGKSSLARAAVGLVRPSAGSVRFNGELVTPLGRRTRPMRQTRLQMVFQDPFSSLNPRRKAGEQIADGLAISGKGSSGQRRVRVGDLLSQVGLPASAASRYPHEFSGGQRQRIAIARTLAAEPTVIVADEPLAALDASIKAQLANSAPASSSSRTTLPSCDTWPTWWRSCISGSWSKSLPRERCGRCRFIPTARR
jgi:ABC-type glutathione transport system ATPase component